MDTSNTTEYIVKQLQSGLTVQDITTQLRSAGLDEASIAAAFQKAQESIQPAPLTATSVEATLPTPPKRSGIKTGWLLFRQSFSIIRQNPGLWRYMIASLLFNFVLLALFAAPVVVDTMNSGGTFITESTAATEEELRYSPTLLLIGLSVLATYLSTVITFYYTTGLSVRVLRIFSGQPSTYGETMSIARSKLPAIATYALIVTIVGYILRFIEQRFKFVGAIVAYFLGILWELATSFAIPVIADSNKSGVGAIRESITLFKANWGETITGRVTLGAVLVIGFMLVAIPLIIISFVVFGPAGLLLGLVALVPLILLVATLDAVATNILNVALYYYANTKAIPPAFSAELLASAFVAKPKK